MGEMTEIADGDWSARLARMVAAEVRRRREQKGMSAQQLSDACSALGHPIHRSVLANFENGRRTTVSVAELLVIARALDTAPVLLMFPTGYASSVEMLPGEFERPTKAVSWVAGDEERRRTAFASDASDYQLANSEEDYIERLQQTIERGLHLPGKSEELKKAIDKLYDNLAAREQEIESLEREYERLSDPSEEGTTVDVTEVAQRLEDARRARRSVDLQRRSVTQALSEARGWDHYRAKGKPYRVVADLQETRAEMRTRGMLVTQLPEELVDLVEGEVRE